MDMRIDRRIATLRRAALAAVLTCALAAPASAQIYDSCIATTDAGTLEAPTNAYTLTTGDSRFSVVGTIEAFGENVVLLAPGGTGAAQASAPAVLHIEFFVDELFEPEIFAAGIAAPLTAVLYEGEYRSLVELAQAEGVPAYLRFRGDGIKLSNLELVPGAFDPSRPVRIDGEAARRVHRLLASGGTLQVDLTIDAITYSTLSVDGAAYADFYRNTVTPILDTLMLDHFSGFC